jgi:arylsulfatase A-like enzyme
LNINGKYLQYNDSTYITDLLTNHALQWLKMHDTAKPFFLYLSHKAVHAPVTPAKRHLGLYANQKYKLPPTYYQTLNDDYKLLHWPEWVKNQRYSWHGVDFIYHTHQNVEEIVQTYCETLMAVDESVGSILNYLKDNGLEQNTIVIYMGDNGFSFGEHGLIDKRHFYEESVKVPFLVYAPGLFKGGQTISKMVQNIDIAPTILELARLKKPDNMPGNSFIKLLKGDSAEWRDKIFYEYFWEYDFPMTPTVFGVRSDRYKFIKYYGIWDHNELYDLENDPNEMYNLIEKPEYQNLVKKMVVELYDWLEQSNGMQVPLKRIIRKPYGDFKHKNQY